MSLIGQIEEFQTTMNRIVEMVEESRSLAEPMPELSPAEISTKANTTIEMCEESISELRKAIEQAEGIIQEATGY